MGDTSCTVNSILPDYLLPAIPYPSFNRVQTQCLDLWRNDFNFFVSAPTGAGKTVCFELAILRVIHKALHSSNTKRVGVNGLPGRIIYLAPTKSLCTEKGQDWKKRFSFLGVRVEVLTGDSHNVGVHHALLNADIVVSTIEKWDSCSRNLPSKTSGMRNQKIVLLLLDEIHVIAEDRGPTFESVVTRMLIADDYNYQNYSSNSSVEEGNKLRVVALSATVANPLDVAEWLRVPHQCCKVFGEEYRPISLQYHVVGCFGKNPWMMGKVYDEKILHLLVRFSDGKPTLIFCTSRKQSITSARALLDKINQGKRQQRQETTNWFARSLPLQRKQRLLKASKECNDLTLRSLIPVGIAVHNADMDPKDRSIVESLFKESLILCLFSTSTLAQGLNYPARVVIVAGTTIYQNGRLQEYDRNLLLQMCGRAGRLGLDTEGIVIIMTTKQLVQKYCELSQTKPGVLESKLMNQFEDSLNAEIVLQSITDVPSAISFLRSTFFWTCETRRVRTNEENMETDAEDIDFEEARIRKVVSKFVDRLTKSGVVNYEADSFGLNSTDRGIAVARYYISLKTIDFVKKNLKQAASPSRVLEVVCRCPELADTTLLRRSEKKRLNELNDLIRMRVPGKITHTWEKIFVLLQVILNESQVSLHSDFALKNEANRLLSCASRICNCILELVLRRDLDVPYESVVASLKVCRSVLCHSFWDGPSVLRQIEGVNWSQAKNLCRRGIWTITKVAESSPLELSNILKCSAKHAQAIVSNANQIPRFNVTVSRDRGSHSNCEGIRLKLSISIIKGTHQQTHFPLQGDGFVLIGCHAHGIQLMQRFSFETPSMEILFHPPNTAKTDRGVWFELIVGADNFLGTDIVHKFNNLQRQTFHELTPVSNSCTSFPDTKVAQNPDLKLASRQNIYHDKASTKTPKRHRQQILNQSVSRAVRRKSNEKNAIKDQNVMSGVQKKVTSSSLSTRTAIECFGQTLPSREHDVQHTSLERDNSLNGDEYDELFRALF